MLEEQPLYILKTVVRTSSKISLPCLDLYGISIATGKSSWTKV